MEKTVLAGILAAAVVVCPMFDNDNSALIPELWAQESLAILEENMVIGNLVYRDFENVLANYGDVVNAHRPANFTAYRKTDADDVTVQAATSANIPVPLNQHIHVSFKIKDGERSTAFVDLVNLYLRPALIAQASFIDKVIGGQTIQFIQNNAGQLGQGSSATIDGYTLDAREKLSINKAPEIGRNLLLTTKTDTLFQKTPQFVSAEKRGDFGTALETANLGRLHGFQLFSAQNQPYVQPGNITELDFLVNNAAGYPAGTTTILVDSGTTSILVGTFLVFDGDNVPQRVTVHVNDTNGHSTSVTVFPGLSSAVANNAQVTIYTPGDVNQSAASLPSGNGASGYDIGYAKSIAFDGAISGNIPKVGQPVNFGDGVVYTIVGVTATTVTLDRPLEVAVLDNAKMFIGPAGAYNLAFLKESLALVCRPLASPPDGMGAISSVMTHNGFAVRVTMSYTGLGQAILVTVDALCGVAVLNANLGCVLLA